MQPARISARALPFLARWSLFLGILLAVGFASGRIGTQTDALARGLGVLALGLALVSLALTLERGEDAPSTRLRRVLGALALTALGGLLLARLPRDARPFVVAACLVVLPLGTSRAVPALARRSAGAVVVHALLVLVLTQSAVGHHALEAWAGALDALAARLSGFSFGAGPQAAGCWLALLAFCLLVASSRNAGSLRHAPAVLGLAAVLALSTQLAFLLAGPFLLEAWNHVIGHGGHGGYLLSELVWLLAPVFALQLAAGLRSEAPALPAARRLRSALGSAALLGLALLALPARPVEAAPVRVLLHDTGYLDDRVPGPQSFGSLGGGMFGHFASALGGAQCRVERGDLSATADLSGYDVLMIVNPLETFADEDLARVQAFVEDGGGLLALGDHTGADAIREPLNAIVGRWGIELEFDSAVAFRSSWEDSMEVLSHPATHGIRRADQVRIWTGASLALAWPAVPLVVGRGAWADAGDLENDERGHLGDMHYRVGERLGDLVLAAAVEPGAGRVLVFGDTSTIQNFSLCDSLPFVAGALRWLAGGGSALLSSGTRELLTSAVLVGLVAVGFGVLGGSWLLLGGLTTLGLAWVLGLAAERPGWAASLPEDGRGVAAVARGTLPVETDLVWERSSLGGLVAHLHRAGLQPIAPDEPLERWIERVALVLLPTPLRLSSRDRDVLQRWVDDGGQVFLTVGAEHSDDVERLLEALQIRLGTLPLGPAEVDLLGGRARLRCANPIESLPAEAEVLARAYGHACAAWIPRGSGGWLVVSDDRFLWNDNLESEDRYVPENSDALLRVLSFLEERR